MKKDIKEKAELIIANLKKENEIKAQNKLNEALSNDSFKAAYIAEQRLMIDSAKKEAEGFKADFESLKKAHLQTIKELEKLGINQDDIKPKYSCPICNDNGYLNGNMCKCLKNQISKLLFLESGFEKLANFKDAKYDIFDCPEKIKKLYSIMKEWCEKPNQKLNILLSGATGVGKTFLTECMANALIESGNLILMTTAFNLNEDLRKYHTTFDEDKSIYIQKYLDCDVLFIDDLGTEPIFKNVTIEYLYLIINERMIKHRAIVITTNLNLSELRDRYGERIFSRIVNKESSICLELQNSDLRLKHNR